MAGEFASTFGEISCGGLRLLCTNLDISREDSFVDLGSGVGKAVVQVALERGTQRSVGIELSKSRHRNAVKAVAALESEMSDMGLPNLLHSPRSEERGHECGAGVLLRQGDILDEGAVEGATVVYLASLCFSDDFMTAIAGLILYFPPHFALDDSLPAREIWHAY